MKFLILTFSLAFTLQAHSAGSINLDGKLRSFSPETIEIQDQYYKYSVKKSKLTRKQLADLKQMKTGDAVKMTVSFDSITDAQKINAAK